MHEHNLDDLIVNNEDQEPKEKKTRNLLTILALLIIVLIITIVLTKIILKDPNVNDSIVNENETELLNPELVLENLIQNQESSDEEAEETLELALSQNEDELISLENTNENLMETDIETDIETSAQKILTDALEESQVEDTKQPTTEASTQTNTTGNYYIQVGSFKNSPNNSYLSRITKSGFKYKIIFSQATQTKKLLIGPYSTRGNANKAIISVKSRINKGAFIIKR